jgi:hypothetical protein
MISPDVRYDVGSSASDAISVPDDTITDGPSGEIVTSTAGSSGKIQETIC